MKKHILIYTKRALRDIKRLDILTQKRLAKFLEKFIASPFSYLKGMSNDKLGQYKVRTCSFRTEPCYSPKLVIRIGNYRISLDIEKEKIIILRLGHRKDIYR